MLFGHNSLVEPARDRWLRPVVMGTARQRASTFAKTLDQPGGLPKWFGRQTAMGMVGQDDLLALAATADADDKRTWDSIVDSAMERAKSRSGAAIGTALHSTADLIDSGESIDHLPSSLRADGEAYRAARRDYEPLAAEVFVYSERFDVAGSLDRLFLHEGRTIIGDMKTSANLDAPKFNNVAWSIQIAAYATGKPYCAQRGLMEWADLSLEAPALDDGVVFHLVQGRAKVQALHVDVGAALLAADIAVRVRNLRKHKFLS